MRFLVDECTGPSVARWLKAQGHEVLSVFDDMPGIDDTLIIKTAFADNWIVLTNDKDFGEKIYRENHPHHGVILLRLANERTANKIAVLQSLLANYSAQIPDRFVVVTERKVRIR